MTAPTQPAVVLWVGPIAAQVRAALETRLALASASQPELQAAYGLIQHVTVAYGTIAADLSEAPANGGIFLTPHIGSLLENAQVQAGAKLVGIGPTDSDKMGLAEATDQLWGLVETSVELSLLEVDGRRRIVSARRQMEVVHFSSPHTPCAPAIRQRFLRDVPTVARRIRNAFDEARFHASQPGVSHLEPTILIIGATWESQGAALLWPLACLVRQTLGSDANYHLAGVFLAACYFSRAEDPSVLDDQEFADAHTLTVLAEGDALLAGGVAWPRIIQDQFASGPTTSRAYFDLIYLVDRLKANDAIVQNVDNPAELILHSVLILEALLLTDVSQHIDTTLLDDYASRQGQTYLGVGAASLALPLDAIANQVETQAFRTIVVPRVFPAAEPLAGTAQTPSRLITDLRHQLSLAQPQLLQAWANALEPIDLLPELWTNLSERQRHIAFVISFPSRSPVAHVRVRGPEPFGPGLSLRVNDVLARLESEKRARLGVLASFREQLKQEWVERQAQILAATGEHVQNLLAQGDDGLVLAIANLTTTLGELELHIMKGRMDAAASTDRRQRVEARVVGERAWLYRTNWVKPISELKPRLTGLLLRAGIMLVLVYQFLGDAVHTGTPLITTLVGENRALTALEFWGWPLVAVVGLVILLWTISFIGTRAIVVSHRNGLAALLQAELNEALLRENLTPVEDLQHFLRAHLTHFQKLALDLRRCLEPADFPGVDLYQYLEQPVTTGSDLAEIVQFKLKHVRTRLAAQNKRFVESWLASDGPVFDWDLQSSESVIAQLQRYVRDASDPVVLRPAETYLRPENYLDRFERLWQATAPWLKPSRSVHFEIEPADFATLIMYGAHQSPFARVALGASPQCSAVSSSDQYGIQLLRVLGAVRAPTLARWAQWQEAFQRQTAENRRCLTLEASILRAYPSFVVLPATFNSESAETENVAAAGLQAATSLVAEWENLDPQIRVGLEQALKPLRNLLENCGDLFPSAGAIVDALKPFDSSWSQLSSVIRGQLEAGRMGLDRWLARIGLVPIEPEPGDEFDVQWHEVTERRVTPTGPFEHVVELLRRGYRNGDELISPAWVVVSVEVEKGQSP